MTGLTPDITAATVVRHGVLRLTFADGLEGEVDILDRMRGPSLSGRGAGRASPRPRSTRGSAPWSGPAARTWPPTRSTSAFALAFGLAATLWPDPARPFHSRRLAWQRPRLPSGQNASTRSVRCGLAIKSKQTAKDEVLAPFSQPVRRWFEDPLRGRRRPRRRLEGDRRRRQRADLRADRVRQDARRLPLGDRPTGPAHGRPRPRGCGSSTSRP